MASKGRANGAMAAAVAAARGSCAAPGSPRCNLLAPEYEYMDPNPDLHALFLEYNRLFFDRRLSGCEVKWSKRMTLCAGLCSFQPRSGFCSIRLSEPLLKLRPRSDLVNTLLHEMIHAFVFVATPVRDHDDHGPLFQAHMQRINTAASTKITVFHSFHDEVDAYRQHIWQCDGPTDRWWADHERTCGGKYTKIKEPPEYTAKQEKKKQRQLLREQKQKHQAQAAPSMKQFFPSIDSQKTAKDKKSVKTPRPRDAKPSAAAGKSNEESEDQNKRQKCKDERESSSGWPDAWGFGTGASVVIAAGDDGDFFLVGDVQALLQAPSGTRTENREASVGFGNAGSVQSASIEAHSSSIGAVVDLTASDSDDDDKEQESKAVTARTSQGRAAVVHTERAFSERTSGAPDVIEID